MILHTADSPSPDTENSATGENTGEFRITRRRMLRTAAVGLGALAVSPVARRSAGRRPVRPSTSCPRATTATYPI